MTRFGSQDRSVSVPSSSRTTRTQLRRNTPSLYRIFTRDTCTILFPSSARSDDVRGGSVVRPEPRRACKHTPRKRGERLVDRAESNFQRVRSQFSACRSHEYTFFPDAPYTRRRAHGRESETAVSLSLSLSFTHSLTLSLTSLLHGYLTSVVDSLHRFLHAFYHVMSSCGCTVSLARRIIDVRRERRKYVAACTRSASNYLTECPRRVDTCPS